MSAIRPADVDARRAPMALVRAALQAYRVAADEIAALDDEAAREWLEDIQFGEYAEECRA